MAVVVPDDDLIRLEYDEFAPCAPDKQWRHHAGRAVFEGPRDAVLARMKSLGFEIA
jgi:hypothetical protein